MDCPTMLLRLLPDSDRHISATPQSGTGVAENRCADRSMVIRGRRGDRVRVDSMGLLKSGTTNQEYQHRDILQFRAGSQEATPHAEAAVVDMAEDVMKRLGLQPINADCAVRHQPTGRTPRQLVVETLGLAAGRPLAPASACVRSGRPIRSRAVTIKKGPIPTMSHSTRKPPPLHIPPVRRICGVCGEPSYSLSGEHPQCAQKRASAMMSAAEPVEVRVAISKFARLDWHYRKRNPVVAPIVPPASVP